MTDSPLIVNFGGGVNSTALLVGYHERGLRPTAIIFADTGSEMPHTYAHLWAIQPWLESVGFPSLEVVRRATGKHASLEAECLTNETLPSLAFGFRGCSAKWKRQVVDRVLKHRYKNFLKEGGRLRRAIGIDFGELHRARFQPEGSFDWEYPLIDWRWARPECAQAIERAGLAVPGKSACFFCPASTVPEVRKLREVYPDLADRAVAMESAAKLTTVKGLGRRWNWGAMLAADAAQARLTLPMVTETPCGCFDGS